MDVYAQLTMAAQAEPAVHAAEPITATEEARIGLSRLVQGGLFV